MSQRKKYWQRCPRCLMRRELCLCSAIPELQLKHKLIIIMTKRELKVPTNTGRLAALALPNSVVLSHGDQEKPYDLAAHFLSDRPSYLLYPADDAPLLTPELAAQLGAINLVVPDGNWRQTSKMRRRDPVMALLPTLRLPPGEPSAYRVRKENKAEGLATLEAIARALGLLESRAVQKELEDLLEMMVSRTLQSRGTPGP